MAATQIFNDTFTEASDNTLASHTPDTGTSWTQVYSTGLSPDLEVKAITDDVRPDTAGSTRGSTYTADATYPSANYRIEMSLGGITGGGSDEQIAIIGRFTAFADNEVYEFDAGNGATSRDPAIYRYTGAGTRTQLAFHDNSNFVGITDGDIMAVDLNGSELVIYQDEVSVVHATDSNITQIGKAGISMGATPVLVGGDLNAGDDIDNFKVTTLADIITSFANPTTTGETNNDFTNPSNAYADDGSYATYISANDTTPNVAQDYGDFGLSIPSDATIVGVQVGIDSKLSSASWYKLAVAVSKDNGASWSTEKENQLQLTADGVRYWGHSASLWGLTWSAPATDFDDDHFRVKIRWSEVETIISRTLSIDHVKVRVFYDSAGGGGVVSANYRMRRGFGL